MPSAILRLDKTGDFVEMDLTNITRIRGQVELLLGAFGVGVLGFFFNASDSPYRWFEPDTAIRFSAENISSAAINVEGFARVRLQVITATATADTIVRASLFPYTPNLNIGSNVPPVSGGGKG